MGTRERTLHLHLPNTIVTKAVYRRRNNKPRQYATLTCADIVTALPQAGKCYLEIFETKSGGLHYWADPGPSNIQLSTTEGPVFIFPRHEMKVLRHNKKDNGLIIAFKPFFIQRYEVLVV